MKFAQNAKVEPVEKIFHCSQYNIYTNFCAQTREHKNSCKFSMVSSGKMFPLAQLLRFEQILHVFLLKGKLSKFKNFA
jgi:hypothetical protein